MSPADVSRRLSLAAADGLATFLAVIAIVAIVLGLMYLVAAGTLPHLLQGHAHAGHHARRAVVCLAAGGGCAVAAWLIRARRRDLRVRRPGAPPGPLP